MKRIAFFILTFALNAGFAFEVHFPALDKVLISSSDLRVFQDNYAWSKSRIEVNVRDRNGEKFRALSFVCNYRKKMPSGRYASPLEEATLFVSDSVTGRTSLAINFKNDKCKEFLERVTAASNLDTMFYIELDLRNEQIVSISSEVPEMDGVTYFTPKGKRLLNY